MKKRKKKKYLSEEEEEGREDFGWLIQKWIMIRNPKEKALK